MSHVSLTTFQISHASFWRISISTSKTNTQMLVNLRWNRKIVQKRLPIATWLPLYNWSKFLQDILAGLTVGLTVVPQGIAYAVIAGLSPEYGLYSGFMGCFVYLIFGGTKDITIGPTAVTALLSQPYVLKLGADLAVLLCFLSGCIIVSMGLLHLGFLVDFISMPVICGFTNAAAILSATSQLHTLLGITSSSNSFIGNIIQFIQNIGSTRLWDTVLGFSSIVFLIILKNIPGERSGNVGQKCIWLLNISRNALVVVSGILVAYLCSINGLTPFKITGNITEGLPPFAFPPFSTVYNNQTYNFIDMVDKLGTGLISVPLITILESIALAKSFSKGRALDSTQEILAVGLCNVFGSFVRSMPVTASFTRTAVNHASGVITPMGGVATGTIVLLTCSFLTSTFSYIPKSTLAAIIIVAMYHTVDLNVFVVLWRTKKIDLLPLTVTQLSCIFLGLEYGMLLGIAINMGLLLYFTARPGVSIENREVDGKTILFVSPMQSLSFPAAEYLRERVLFHCEMRNDYATVVVDGRHVHRIDATVARNLKLLQADLESRHQTLIFWNWCQDAQVPLTGYDDSLAVHFRTCRKLSDIFSGSDIVTQTSLNDLC
ncbi:sodium-independent sulfate anion transporter isoform X2 [Cephus cinctus]|uniref:Sodium-independent sulfate anion transporter isoform X2 n=1 Tax=Cephus cinctus TaxID=211228 RepID=A0AAJ7FLN8_CEPCN|nr:sodium-independent sulfate anion transporter isoform X2 [Cephus cinctus]